MIPLPGCNRRILLVDDNSAIHQDFRRILITDEDCNSLDAEAALLFRGRPVPVIAPIRFELVSAYQVEEAIKLTQEARGQERPFALAFVDTRMPPGMDGLSTIVKLWEVDPDLQIVICTAYSDHGWVEIQAALPARDRWLVLKKPFDKIEILQLAQSLTEKWSLTRAARVQLAAVEKELELSRKLLREQSHMLEKM